MYDKIKSVIEYYVEMGKRNFVIYPYGKIGKIVKEVLNSEFGIQEKYIVDNVLCEENSKIKSVDEMREDYKKDDFMVLLAVKYKPPKSNIIYHQIADFVSSERLVDVLSPSTYFNPSMHYEEVKSFKYKRHLAIECIAREIYKNGIGGAVAEAGVYKGVTAQVINRCFPDRKLYLFDTFEGFDERDQIREDEENRHHTKLDFTDTSVEFVLEQMIYPNNCIIKKGWFPKSASGIEEKFAFVRLDMDLYEPIYAGLEFFYPLMEKGGYIAVHDCRSRYFDGARNALLDFCREKHLNYMCMPDPLGKAVICIGF